MVYTKAETMKTKEILEVCKKDFLTKKEYIYYNKAWLLNDFSPWDGSYNPLEKIIKDAMNDPSSYEHEETRYSFVLNGTTRPYMKVQTVFRGKNAFGGLVKNTISIKVDAKTKEIFDIVQ